MSSQPVPPTILLAPTQPPLSPTCPLMAPEMQREVTWAWSWPSGSSPSCGDRVAHKPLEDGWAYSNQLRGQPAQKRDIYFSWGKRMAGRVVHKVFQERRCWNWVSKDNRSLPAKPHCEHVTSPRVLLQQSHSLQLFHSVATPPGGGATVCP